MSPAVALQAVRKTFGSGAKATAAVDGVTLEIADGEFFSLLGPSGSGKTTLLRLIAGFEQPTTGTVALGGVDVTRQPPFRRDVNTVFQDYALFPHLDVLGNVEYGLRVKGVGRPERWQRAEQALATVRLEGFGERSPAELSGGQRQRVALARAIVNKPRVLLLDEPLGALDLKLREQMQVELKAIQRELGITFLVVTHDQDEALTMSDRIAVLDAGRVQQIGAPSQVYERPASAFVADFVGASNLLGPAHGGGRLVQYDGTFSIRPEKIALVPLEGPDAVPAPEPGADEVAADGAVREVVYSGATTKYLVDLEGGGQLVVIGQNSSTSQADVAALRGRRVRLTFARRHAVRMPDPDQTTDERSTS